MFSLREKYSVIKQFNVVSNEWKMKSAKFKGKNMNFGASNIVI
jgi:hypothetical protein